MFETFHNEVKFKKGAGIKIPVTDLKKLRILVGERKHIITCLSNMMTFQTYKQTQVALASFKSQVSFFKNKLNQH